MVNRANGLKDERSNDVKAHLQKGIKCLEMRNRSGRMYTAKLPSHQQIRVSCETRTDDTKKHSKQSTGSDPSAIDAGSKAATRTTDGRVAKHMLNRLEMGPT